MNVEKKRRFFDDKKKKSSAKKNDAKKSKGLFVETYAVAPSPSRDYYALQLYQKKFLLTRWKISHGPYTTPVQKSVSLDEFKNDSTLQYELTYIFGKDTTNLINDLANQRWSLTSMPSGVLQKIFFYISVPDILRLSQVCKRLSKECSSNELWKNICKKQWKILVQNDIEKASLIGWKTVYLEKMRPKKYKIESEHQAKHLVQKSRFHSATTINMPNIRTSLPKSNFVIHHKKTQDVKKSESIGSSSETLVKDFKVFSTSTGKSTERTFNANKTTRNSCKSRQNQNSGEKIPLSPRRYLQQSSYSTITLAISTERQRQKESIREENKTPSSIKSKITCVRARSAISQSVQPTIAPKTKLRTERSRPNTGKLNTSKQ